MWRLSFLIAAICFVAPLCRAVETDAPIVSQNDERRDYKSVYVVVALCDNEHQGIVKVRDELGNGRDPSRNLYWGAMYGVKTFFAKSDNWKVLSAEKPPDKPEVLDTVAFESTNGPKVFVLADAFNGAHMKEAVETFFNAVAASKVDLVCFVGHNGLMDIRQPPIPEGRHEAANKSAMVLACVSRQYFETPVTQTGRQLVLSTTGLMAPEAYVLDAAIRSWAAGDEPSEIRRKASVAYAKYQNINPDAAESLFFAPAAGGTQKRNNSVKRPGISK